MAKRTYIGSPHEVTSGWKVDVNPDGEGFVVMVDNPCDCDCKNCTGVVMKPHTNGMIFEEMEDAYDWIEAVQENLDDDYDRYYEENHYEIAQMERYEMWRSEY